MRWRNEEMIRTKLSYDTNHCHAIEEVMHGLHMLMSEDILPSAFYSTNFSIIIIIFISFFHSHHIDVLNDARGGTL